MTMNPTMSPSWVPSSSATLAATEAAAARLGCVHAICRPSSAQPACKRYCVTWVVLPEPEDMWGG